MRNCVRERDILERFGGEEVVLLMPDTERTVVEEPSQRIRPRIANGTIGAE